MSLRNKWIWSYTSRLGNCSSDKPEGYVFSRENSTIILTPDEGYTLDPNLTKSPPSVSHTAPFGVSAIPILGVWDSSTGTMTFDITPMFVNDSKIGTNVDVLVLSNNSKAVPIEEPEPEPEPEPTKLVMDYQSSDLVECWCNYTSGEEIVTTKNILIQPLEGVGFNENTLFPILINGVEYLPTVDTMGRLAYDTKLFDYEIGGTHKVTFKEPIVPVPIAYGYLRIWSGLSFINCSINYVDGEDVNLDKPLIIQADEGYEFLGDVYDVYTMNPRYDYDMINLGDKLYFEFTNVQVGNWSLGSPPNNEYKATPIPTREGKFTSSANLENCSINYVDGEDLKVSKPIKIMVDDGYVFKGSYVVNLVDKEGNHYPLINHRNYLEFIVVDEDLSLELVGDIIAVEDVVVSLSSFTDIFKISDSELSDLSKRRWLDTDLMPIDLGSYINNLYVFPVHIEDGLIGTRREIYLGKYRTNVNSYIINSYEYVIDLGTIEVPEIYHNVYDYINTKCILYLPFFDKIYLNNEYVIGQSLYIDYVVNLYTGYVTMNIISSFTGEIIDSKNSLISVNIPFMQGTNVIGGFNNNSKNVISKAYVEVVRNIPYNVNTPFGKNVIEYGKLIDYNGYIECDNIQLNSSATNREKSDIVTLLGKGVYINENK